MFLRIWGYAYICQWKRFQSPPRCFLSAANQNAPETGGGGSWVYVHLGTPRPISSRSNAYISTIALIFALILHCSSSAAEMTSLLPSSSDINRRSRCKLHRGVPRNLSLNRFVQTKEKAIQDRKRKRQTAVQVTREQWPKWVGARRVAHQKGAAK